MYILLMVFDKQDSEGSGDSFFMDENEESMLHFA